MKRLTRSPSSRTTIAAAGAFVGVDRVDPVRRFGRSQSVKIVEAAAAVTVICGRSSRRFSTSPPVTAADVVLLIRVTISRPARPARAGPRPGGHPCLARRTEVNAAGGFFDHPLNPQRQPFFIFHALSSVSSDPPPSFCFVVRQKEF